MTSASHATAAPVPVRLAGQDYRMTPLTDKDYAEFENWMRSRPIRIAKENMARIPDLTKEDRDVLLRQAMEISARLSMTNMDGMQVMVSWEGASYLSWLGLKKCHPELTSEDVVRLMSDPRTVQEALDNFDRVNSLKTEPVDGDTEKKGGLEEMTPIQKATMAVVGNLQQIAGQSTVPFQRNTVGPPPK